jgi:hypothetical protein
MWTGKVFRGDKIWSTKMKASLYAIIQPGILTH